MIEALLADFRIWLEQAPPPAVPPPPAPVDWDTLVAGWTALRHEINLQTRASRAQLEQNAQALAALTDAVAALREVEPPRAVEPPADDEAVRPLLKTLIDVHDALALAHREVQRLNANLPEPTENVSPSFWARLFGRGKPAEPPADEARQKVDALLVGYGMSVQRVERALQQHGLEPIPTVGQPFDPERMEAVEVVRDGGRAGTEVLDEVRRGYLWRGRVFRFAQVRVARP